MTTPDAAPPVHPIALEQVFFTRTVVVAIPEYRAGEGAVVPAPDNRLEVAPMANAPGRYLATMRSTLNADGDPAHPYTIDMECIAILVVDDSLTGEDAQRGVTITAHSVLYGAIREAVSWITGRHPHGAVMLGLSVLQSRPPASSRQ